MSRGAQNPAAIQATATAKDVTVSTVPVLAAMPQKKERPDFEVLVRVRAPTDATLRAPIDLVAVLDVSGSMDRSPEADAKPKDGERSRLDLLKDAMRFIVDHLHVGDRLAMVAFDHNIVEDYCTELEEISDDSRKSLRDSVNRITTRGCTLFAPGLDKAVEILEKSQSNNTGKEKRVGFIVFLSDGVEYVHPDISTDSLSKKYPSPNGWKELEDRLKEHAVHTFGFSKFHDPTPLHAIAGFSGGTYSFLNTGLDKITDAFAFCLGGLRTVVAADVTIDLAVQDTKVKITSVDSGGYGSKVEDDRRSGRITIPVLYAGEVKDFVVHLSVPSHGRNNQRLLHVDGQCRLSGAGAVEIKEDVVRIERPLADEQQPKQDGEVIKQVLRFKVLQMLKGFLDTTNLKKEKADSAAKSLGEMWGKLKDNLVAENPSIWSDLDDQSVVERYDGYVKKMQTDLEKGDGGAHVLAWDSSNKLQRVTTMGSPENVVPEFKTDEIKKMGGEAKKQRGEEIPALSPPPEVEPPAAAKPALLAPEERPWPCACLEYDMIGKQLEYWSVVKRDLLRLVRQVEGDGGHHSLTGTFHDLSLASINRAMYESVFLAVEHAHNLRSCYCAATGHRAVAAGYDGEER